MRLGLAAAANLVQGNPLFLELPAPDKLAIKRVEIAQVGHDPLRVGTMPVHFLQIKEHPDRPHIRLRKFEFCRFRLKGKVRLQPNRPQVAKGQPFDRHGQRARLGAGRQLHRIGAIHRAICTRVPHAEVA